jgi:hypothetical protein
MLNNSEFSEFLERGWESEAELFFNGKIYVFECCMLNDNKFELTVYSFKANKNDDKTFSSYIDKDNTRIDYKLIVNSKYDTKQKAKEACFSLPIFEGNKFREIEDQLYWLENSDDSIEI